MALMVLPWVLLSSGAVLSQDHQAGTTSSLERARELLAEKKPADALAALSSFSPLHEERSSYHHAYARTLVALKQPYESIEHYRLAYTYATMTAERERLLLERAEVYAGMRYYSEAAVCYEVFLRQFPKSGLLERAELGIADARYHTGDMRSSLAHYEKAGQSSRARMGKANVLQALGRTPEAHEAYQQLMEHDPKSANSSPETLYAMGENYRLMGKPKDARVYFESVKDPVLKYRASLGLGLLAMAEDLNDAAVAHFTAAAESAERTIRREAIMYRAEANMKMKKYDIAKTALVEIKNSYPYGKTYESAVLLLARLHRAEGKSAESVALLKTLIYRRNPVPAALDEIELIIMETKDKNHDEFVKLWNIAGKWLLHAERTRSLIAIAQGLRHDGKPFFEISRWLIKYGSEEAKSEGRLLLADFYIDAGDESAAWSFLKRARFTVRNERVLRIEAKILLARNDAQKAAAALMSIQEPTEADILLLLRAMKKLKNIDKQLAFCEQAFKKSPASTRVAVRLADVLALAGHEQKALAYYHAATAPQQSKGRLSPDSEWAHYRIATLSPGKDASASLTTLQSANSPFGRYAAAELKGMDLKSKF